MTKKVLPGVPIDEWAIQPSKADPRDYTYTLKVADPRVTAEVRPKRFLNHRYTVRDQGKFGTCGAEAVADAADLREGLVMSALFVYSQVKQIDGISGEGTDIKSLMKVYLKQGICEERLYPYEQYKERLKFPEIPRSAQDDAAKRKISGYARCLVLDEVLDAIWKYRSVVCGLLITENFKHPQSGFVDLPEGTILGGHAVNLVGYDENMVSKYSDGHTYKGFCYLDNSWGKSWGLEGGAWIPFAYLFGRCDLTPYAWDFFAPIDQFPVGEEWVTMDIAPFVQDGRTFTPVRYVAEAMGAKVNWYPEEKRVEVVGNEVIIDMWIGRKECRVRRGVTL